MGKNVKALKDAGIEIMGLEEDKEEFAKLLIERQIALDEMKPVRNKVRYAIFLFKINSNFCGNERK